MSPFLCDVWDDANECRVEEDIGYRLEHGNGASVGLYVAFSSGVGSFGKMECHSYLILLVSKLN